ncbi:MAG: phage tail tape measure protein [Pseudomonadota bacterium]
MLQTYQLKALITGVDKLSPMIKEMQKKLRGLQREFRIAGNGALPMAATVGVGIGASAKAFADAENAAVGLEVAMMRAGGTVVPEFKKITALANQLGNKLPGTTADFQNMMTMLVRQGVPAENIINGLGKATAYLAVQLQKPPVEAAEFAAKMQDATKTTSEDMMGLMDVIQRSFYMGIDDGNMLAAFGKLAPALDMIKQKGLAGAKAMAPLVVMMDQAGMSGEASGNAIRKVLQSGFNAKKVSKANAIGGLNMDFTNGKGEFGGVEKMFAELGKLKGLTTQRRTGVLTALFGDDAETLQVASLLIDKGLSGYQDVQTKMAAQAGLQERVNRQLGTLKNMWDAASGTFTNALVSFGEALSPELKALTEMFGSLSGKVQRLSQENPALVRSVAAVAVGLVAFKLAALGAGMAVRLLGALTAATPLGIFIRLLAVGASLVIANWDSVVTWFKGMWERIKPYVQPIIDFFGSNSEVRVRASAAVTGGRQGSAPRVSPVRQQAMAAKQQLQGQINVSFDNAPPGMRVSPAKTSQPGVRMTPDVGYNRFAY